MPKVDDTIKVIITHVISINRIYVQITENLENAQFERFHFQTLQSTILREINRQSQTIFFGQIYGWSSVPSAPSISSKWKIQGKKNLAKQSTSITTLRQALYENEITPSITTSI